MIFKVIIRPDAEDGGFNVSCPALPGCHSQGDSEEEALANIREAILGCLEVLNERAIPHNTAAERIFEVAVN
jgi:antitoxin HicB